MSVCPVSYTYDFGINAAPILLFLSNLYLDREKISGPAATLLTAVIDLLDVLPLAIVFIADPGADFDHCDRVQTFVMELYDLMRIGKPAVKKHIFRFVSGFHRFVNKLDHDIGPFGLCHDPSFSGKRPFVIRSCLSKDVFFFGRGQ